MEKEIEKIKQEYEERQTKKKAKKKSKADDKDKKKDEEDDDKAEKDRDDKVSHSRTWWRHSTHDLDQSRSGQCQCRSES